jgi:hypothetical protein
MSTRCNTSRPGEMSVPTSAPLPRPKISTLQDGSLSPSALSPAGHRGARASPTTLSLSPAGHRCDKQRRGKSKGRSFAGMCEAWVIPEGGRNHATRASPTQLSSSPAGHR